MKKLSKYTYLMLFHGKKIGCIFNYNQVSKVNLLPLQIYYYSIVKKQPNNDNKLINKKTKKKEDNPPSSETLNNPPSTETLNNLSSTKPDDKIGNLPTTNIVRYEDLELNPSVGTSSFKIFVAKSTCFVDKSMLIKLFIKDGSDVLLLTWPRRFGKSLNISMIVEFLRMEVDEDGNRIVEEKRVTCKYFKGGEVEIEEGEFRKLKPLLISYHTDIINKYLGQYPVIYISLIGAHCDSYEDIEDILGEIIKTSFEEHKYLKKYTEESSKLLDDEKKEKLKKFLNINKDKDGNKK